MPMQHIRDALALPVRRSSLARGTQALAARRWAQAVALGAAFCLALGAALGSAGAQAQSGSVVEGPGRALARASDAVVALNLP